MKTKLILMVLAAAALSLACDQRSGSVLVKDDLPVTFVDESAEFSPLHMGNWTTMNDRCMVRRAKLNLKMPPVYVSGRPVGFC